MNSTTSSSAAMPPKARLPGPREYLPFSERPNALTKKRTKKSRSKDRPLGAQDFGRNPLRMTDTAESLHEYSTAYANSVAEATEFASNISDVGSVVKQRKLAAKTSQTQLHNTPSQRSIYKLLQAFKLQQYAKTFIDQGFGDDVYKLAMMSARKKQELFGQIDFVPGHKQRLIDLFRRIDLLYPRQNVSKTIDSATKVSSSYSQSRLSGSTSAEQASSLAISSIHKPSRESVTTMSGSVHNSILNNTQPVVVKEVPGIKPPTQFVPKRRPLDAKSPTSRGATSIQPSSLTRRFNQLDPASRASINDNFVSNIRAGKVQAATVSDALRQFYGQDKQMKQKVINKIFQSNLNNGAKSGIKPHPSLQQPAQSAPNGFGLQRFVSVQKGSQKIEQYRMQVSTSNQKMRSEIQPTRRIDKRAMNTNGSNESARLTQQQPLMSRKGSHPPKPRKKTSTSSERRENATLGALVNANLGNKVQSIRQQMSTQNRQQRSNVNDRLLLNQNCNFAIAPNSSRKELSKLSKQQASANPASAAGAPNQGRTRLHRVRSAQGRKDMANSANPATTIQSALNDYALAQGKEKLAKQQATATKNSAQKAALDRLKLHRQRSANKQRTQLIGQNTQVDERFRTKNGSKQSASTTKPPTAGMPTFIQQNQGQLPATAAIRKRVSRDRAQLDLGSSEVNNSMHIGATTDSTNDYSSGRNRLLKRASSQGMSQCELMQPSSTRRSTMAATKSKNVADTTVRKSAANTEFKMRDDLTTLENSNLPAIETKSITSTVKRVIQDKVMEPAAAMADDQDCLSVKSSTSMTNLANSSGRKPGRPPKSPLKRNRLAESDKSSYSIPQTPEKANLISSIGLMTASPKRPLLLDPLANAPTIPLASTEANNSRITPSKNMEEAKDNTVLISETEEQMESPEAIPEEKVSRETIQINWTPLLNKEEKMEARDYGYSFGSKKVAMGPGFINLRFMCHCLARAIKSHIAFSKGEHWFLQDLQAEKEDIDLEFSYQLPPDLKLTLNPRGVRINDDDDDDDDRNPFQREDALSPVRDIETMDIEVDASKIKTVPVFDRKNSSGCMGLGEPEPEQIKSSDDEGSVRLSNLKPQESKCDQFSNAKAGQPRGMNAEDEISEELDTDNYSEGFYHMEEEDPEEQSIKEIRRDQLRKSVLEKDERKLKEQLNQQKVKKMQKQLKSKDKQIAQLTQLVSNGFNQQEVMAISDDPQLDDDGDEMGFFDQKGVKMDRAEWLMAQVDLDPIESHGSMEMSTTKFMQGKRFANSGAIDDSSKLSKRTEPQQQQKQQEHPVKVQQKKKKQRTAESGYVDVSEDKMREFVMSQLRHFDMRMEYDELVFDEDQFVAMPTEKYIAEYCKYVTIACKMENEIPIVCLVYLEKLLLTTGILLNKWNWRRLVLICLTLASKIWDDDSLENVHFPKVMSDVTNAEINKLEQLFLEFIDYKLVIKGSEYAKYYFIMRSLADDITREKEASEKKSTISPFENARRNKNSKEEWAEFPLRAPISADKMLELQRQEAKAEVYLKERHEREFLHAYIGNVEGSRKDKTRHPSLLLDRTM